MFNRNCNLKIVFIVSFFTLLFIGNTQLYTKTQSKITGTVISQQENSPLPSATVALHKVKDSSVVTGAITQKTGEFTINADDGDYYLVIKFLGYETKIIPDIKISKPNTNIELGEIKLNQTAVMQKEVTVEAEKETVTLGIDSKTYKIDNDFKVGTVNILDVLKKIPSVSVDFDDNIKMAGKTPKILVDNRESSMSSKEMLKILSSDIVESVELIENPSAKYEAEGVTGIINIKLKKNRDDGFTGMVSLSGGSDFEFKYQKNGSANLSTNYKLNKFNLFGSINFYNWSGLSDWMGQRTSWFTGDTTYTDRFGNSNYNSNSYSARFGVDYDITDKDLITFSANISNSKNDNGSSSKYDVTNQSKQIIKKSIYSRESDGTSLSGDITFNYKKILDGKNHNLYFDAYYSSQGGDNESNTNNHFTPETSIDTMYLELLKTNSDNRTARGTIQLDYENDIEYLGSLSTGLKANLRKTNNDNINYKFNNATDIFEINKILTNIYKYNDEIYSAYFTVGNKFGDFSYRAGLRAEYTDWTFDSRYKDSVYTDSYLGLSPSLRISYSLAKAHTFSLNYSRRFSRPWYSELDPFENWSDSSSVSTGNPYLKPSYYNSYYFGYSLYTSNTSVSASVSYSSTNNARETFHSNTPWGLISKPINIAKNSSLSLSLSLTQTITSWWNINCYAGISNSKYEASEINVSRSQTSWSGNLYTTIKLIDNLRWSISGFYFSSSLSLQGKGSAFYMLNSGLSYDLLDKKMSIGLNFNNLLYPDNSEYSSAGQYFTAYSRSNWSRRGFSLSLSYRINDYQQKMKRRVGDEDAPGGGSPGGGSGNI